MRTLRLTVATLNGNQFTVASSFHFTLVVYVCLGSLEHHTSPSTALRLYGTALYCTVKGWILVVEPPGCRHQYVKLDLLAQPCCLRVAASLPLATYSSRTKTTKLQCFLCFVNSHPKFSGKQRPVRSLSHPRVPLPWGFTGLSPYWSWWQVVSCASFLQ